MVAIIIIIYLDCTYKMNHIDIDRQGVSESVALSFMNKDNLSEWKTKKNNKKHRQMKINEPNRVSRARN